uniref:Uncharacterized protein n=1 Tax=Anguilla anguilla TaxID=7936 RepID=A0A0E9UX47_ANGAN
MINISCLPSPSLELAASWNGIMLKWSSEIMTTLTVSTSD